MKKGVRLCITGSEVMNGFVLDKNTQFFASELYALGYELKESRILHDDRDQILRTWNEYRATGDIIVNSGGLGPTTDDLTVDLLCEWLGDTAVYDPHSEKRTRYFFERRAKDQRDKDVARSAAPGKAQAADATKAFSLELALRQARLPSRARAIKNTVGLAPGIFLPEVNFIALPGFPEEIKGMWAETLAIIEEQGIHRAPTKIIPVWGVGESQLFGQLPKSENVTVGVHALPWGCRLFLRGEADSAPVENVAQEVVEKYPGQTVADPLADLIQFMKENNLKLALAESCTGGLASKQVTDIAGVSAVFQGGAVTYANSAKQAYLDVQPEILEKHGAVSSQCAAAMAEGVARRLGADIALSFTGIAGPDGGSQIKPVGTVFIGMHDARSGDTRVGRFLFPFGRDRFRAAAVACGFLALWQRHVYSGEKPWPNREFQ